MPKNTRQDVTEAYLRSVPTPNHADTYTVITHGFIIDKIQEQLTANGFTIEDTLYHSSMFGDVARGKVYIKSVKDPDMGMIFTWINSYNKMVKFSCAIGGFIYDNKTSFIGSEGMSWIRRHTGTADEEAVNVIEQLIEHAEEHFDSIIEEKNRMKNITLSPEEYGCIMGALYFEHELITPNQATLVKKVYQKTIAKQSYTLWDLYKILMFGLDTMDIRKWQSSQQKLHHMIMTEYAIAIQDTPSVIMTIPTAIGDEDDTQEQESLLAKKDLEAEIDMVQSEAPQELIDALMNAPEIEVSEVDMSTITFVDTPEAVKEIEVAPTRVKFAIDNTQDDEEEFDPELELLTTSELIDRYGDQVDVNEMDAAEEDLILLSPMTEEQIEMVKEDFGVVDKINTTVDGIFIEETFDNDDFMDIPEHDGLVLPANVIQQAAMIEKRMIELYGSVRDYHIEETEKQINVTIDVTRESFYITL